MSKSGLMGMTILGGLLSATLALLPMTFPSLVLLSCFVPLPFFLLGLGLGLRPLLGAGLFATAFVFLFEGPLLTAEFVLFSFLGPVFVVHRALFNLEKPSGEPIWYPLAYVLKDLTLLAGIVMVLALGVYLYLVQGETIHIITKNIVNVIDSQENIKGLEPLLVKIFPFLPGFFTFSWMLTMLFNAAIAQGFLARIKANLRPTPLLESIVIPRSFLIVLGLSLLLSFVGVGTLGLLGKNAALMLAFPFFLGGLAIVHHVFHQTSFAKVGLTIFYVLILLFLWPALLVIFLGMVRPCFEKSMSTN